MEPFTSAEEAWFWTIQAIDRRRTRAPHRPACCTPECVLRCLDDIYRRRRIVLLHVEVLKTYGRRGRPPRPGIPAQRCDLLLWREAMAALDDRLRQRGIVAGVAPWPPEA